MKWWKANENFLPNWAVQLSSAAAERVFLLLSTSFGSQQDSSLKDYIESSLMLRYKYNKHSSLSCVISSHNHMQLCHILQELDLGKFIENNRLAF